MLYKNKLYLLSTAHLNKINEKGFKESFKDYKFEGNGKVISLQKNLELKNNCFESNLKV